MKILWKNFQTPGKNPTHDLPVTSLDALTTELQYGWLIWWAGHRLGVISLRTSHLTSTLDTRHTRELSAYRKHIK